MEKKLTKQEIIKFLNSRGIAKQLKFLATMIDETTNKFRLVLKYNGDTYTDGKDVFIGVPEYLEGYTGEEIFSCCKAMVGHEVSHKNYTSDKGWVEFINNSAEYLVSKSKINENLAKKVTHYIINSIEDGRIERLLVKEFEGLKSDLVLFRGHWWDAQPVTEITQNSNVYFRELFDSLFALCTKATMGLYPKRYISIYGTNTKLIDMLECINKHIQNAVNSNTFEGCIKHTWKVVYALEDWMIELMEKLSEDEMKNKLDDMNSQFGEISEDNCTGGSMSQPAPSKSDLDADNSNSSNSQSSDSSNSSNETDKNDNSQSSSNSQSSKNDKSDDEKSSNLNGNSDDNTSKDDKDSNGKSSNSDENSDDKSDENSGSGDSKEESDDKSDEANGQSKSDNKGNEKTDDSSDDSSDEADKGNEGNSDEDGDESNEIHNAFRDKRKPVENSTAQGIKSNSNESQDNQTSNFDLRIDSTINDNELEDTDEDMDEIVREAVKDAKKEVIEDAHDSIIQAEYDDIMEQRKEEEEKAKAKGTNLNDNELEEITDKRIKGCSWRFRLNFYKHQYAKVEAPLDIKTECIAMKKDFKQLLTNKTAINSRNRVRGRLDTTKLWKIRNDDYKIFSKKGTPKNNDYVFEILVDGSGSMGGYKYEEAYRATTILEEALKEFVPLKITQFTSFGNTVTHDIIKDFDDNEGNHSWAYVNRNNPKGGNADGISIRVALAELAKRPERDKVLIVLSDGQPNANGGYTGKLGQSDVKSVVREGRKQGVKIFNIMLGSEKDRNEMIDSFEFMYEKGIVSCPVDKISKELIRVVKREIDK